MDRKPTINDTYLAPTIIHPITFSDNTNNTKSINNESFNNYDELDQNKIAKNEYDEINNYYSII